MDTLDTATDDTRRALLADPETRELARVEAWCQFGAQTIAIRDGRLVGIPDGWPACVTDPDKFIAERVDALLYQPKE